MSFYFNTERFFDWQIGNLDGASFSEAREILLDSKKLVLDFARSFGFEKGNLPFLPVLSWQEFDIDLLVKKVKGGHFEGENSIHTPYIREDSVYFLRKIYYIFDVEVGKNNLGTDPLEAKEKINKANRSCMNIDEVVSLGAHSNFLKRHNAWAPESYDARDEKKIAALTLYLRRPRLSFLSHTNIRLWGTPSYKDSFGLL
jgi:hypothetical protein